MSNEPALFTAFYSDLKFIKTRDAVQVIFELPREASVHAMNVLGGMPNPGEERLFAIARMNKEK